MKTKFLYIVSAVLMTLGFAACSGSEDLPEGPQNNNPGVKKTYTINLSLGSAATRTVLAENEGATSEWKWNAGEQLVLSDESGQFVTMLTLKENYTNPKTEEVVPGVNENLAVFTGVSDYEIFTGKTYRVTYMGYGKAESALNKTNMTFTVNFADQDGTVKETGLGKCDAMSETVTFSKDFSDNVYFNEERVVLRKLFSVVHFQLNDQDTGFTNVATSICGEGVYKAAQVKINAAATAPSVIVTDADKAVQTTAGALNFTNLNSATNTSGSIYITMVPGENVAPIFKRVYDGTTTAYGTPGKASSLNAGYIYRIASTTNGIPVEMKYDSPINPYHLVVDWANGEEISQEFVYTPSN